VANFFRSDVALIVEMELGSVRPFGGGQRLERRVDREFLFLPELQGQSVDARDLLW
jgi:hypothetical protein